MKNFLRTKREGFLEEDDEGCMKMKMKMRKKMNKRKIN